MAWQFHFGNLGHIFAKLKTILAEISIKIFGLVIFPFKFLVLNPVLTEFHRIHLGLFIRKIERPITDLLFSS